MKGRATIRKRRTWHSRKRFSCCEKFLAIEGR
jgi:hypothetical protein